jgi:hypothetical protein
MQCRKGSVLPRVQRAFHLRSADPVHREASLRIMHAPDNGEADSFDQFAN